MSAIVNNDPQFNVAPDIDEDEIDLSDLIGVLIENRWLIIGITLAALMVGAYKAFVAVPIYQADALVQVEESRAARGEQAIGAQGLGRASGALGDAGLRATSGPPAVAAGALGR